MNDIERIIDDLKTTVEFLLQDRYVSKSTKEEFDLAILALEKQIPKNAMGEGSTKEVGYCPNCKSHLMYEPKTNYCRWCGQRLLWEVESD